MIENRPIVRLAGPGDLHGLKEALFFLHEQEPWSEDGHEQASEIIARVALDSNRGIFVAERDGSIIGTVDVIVVENFTRGLRPFAVIENVVVRPENRRKGVGRALMERAISFAIDHGCYKVQLISADRRDAAQSLYASLGFDANVTGYRRYLDSVD